MAKKPKKAAKKPAPKPAKKTAPKKAAGKARATKPAARATKDVKPKAPKPPRNPSLPGMEHVRYRELDAYCESIGAARDKKNAAIMDEKGYTQGALQAMVKRDCHTYKHAGVELILVPGDAKLRVRLLKDDEGEGADVPHAPAIDPEAGDPLDDRVGAGTDDGGEAYGDPNEDPDGED
jgi:hypothetical protein